jgi:hypothetical protein
LAVFQSRITVTGEILSTSAISATLSPPKNRMDDLHFAGIDPRQRIQRIIESHEVRSSIGANFSRVFEGNVRYPSPSF